MTSSAWTRLVALDGDLARAEPKRLRYCLLRAGRRVITAAADAPASASQPAGPGPPTSSPRSHTRYKLPPPSDRLPASSRPPQNATLPETRHTDRTTYSTRPLTTRHAPTTNTPTQQADPIIAEAATERSA